VKIFSCRYQTAFVHSLELALDHRKQSLIAEGMGKQAVLELQFRLQEAMATMRVERKTHMGEMQQVLHGNILCELCNRCCAQTPRHKRCRLTWKQSVAPSYESMSALLWLTGLLVDETTSKERVQDCLQTFLNSDEVVSLQQLLRDAVQRDAALPLVARCSGS